MTAIELENEYTLKIHWTKIAKDEQRKRMVGMHRKHFEKVTKTK